MHTSFPIALAFILAAAPISGPAQDSPRTATANPGLLRTLQGDNARNGASSGVPGFKKRGSGGSGSGAAPKTAERRVFVARGVTSRGVPKGTQSFDRPAQGTDSAPAASSPLKVASVTAPASNPDSQYGDLPVSGGEKAYEITYKVDPSSKLSTTDIKFQKGNTTLADDASHAFLEELAATLNHPTIAGFKYIIEGHASAEGDAASNQLLSQDRADAIFAFLKRRGVSEDRIFPVGYGETQARFPDASPEHSLSQDRRVQIFKLEE